MFKHSKFCTYLIAAMLLFYSCGEDSIEINGTGTLTGTVVESGTNLPLENVKISTNPASSTVFTNAEGNFIIETLEADQYSVQAEFSGFDDDFEPANITEGATVNVVFELEVESENNDPPTTPLLILPTDNAVDLPLSVDFEWSASDPDEDNLTYTLILRNDIDEEVLNFTVENQTQFTVNSLRFGLRYFWQVSVTDNVNDEILLSEVRAFETTNSPENRLLYVRKINGNNVIFSSDEMGGNELQLTDSNVNSFRPRRNILANRIAFLSNSGSETHIFTMDLDGSNIQQVTSQVQVSGFNLEDVDFDWLQNGSQLIYPSFNRLYTINRDGTGLQQIYETVDGSLISEVVPSVDGNIIALKTNESDGYNVSIFTINRNTGAIIDDILSNVNGAAGGLDISVDNNFVVFWHDVSGFESFDYRQLNSRIFLYNRTTADVSDLSDQKPSGTNDFDCRFVPNEVNIIITNTSNDGISQRNLVTIDTDPNSNTNVRNVTLENAEMPDFE